MGRLRRSRFILALAAIAVPLLAGCGGATSTTTVQAPTAATSSSASQTATGPAPDSPQVFHGDGQQNLGTIVVGSDSTISWNCPGCGSTNFIIHNAQSDDNTIPTNGLDQVKGVDPIPAGTYHTVVVDTDGGPWTVAIGATAAAPTTGSSSPPPNSQSPTSDATASAAPSGYTQCDANVSAKASTTDCQFAENVFYEYWAHSGASSFSVYSPSTGSSFDVQCVSSDPIVCTTNQDGAVSFSQSSINNYSQSQAAGYAASHNLGP